MKQISQDHFDGALYENMELFDLSLDEIIEDTCNTFTLQGIDLSNIIKDKVKYEGCHPTDLAMKRFMKLSQDNEPLSPEMVTSIEELTSLCSVDEAHRYTIAKLGAFDEGFKLLIKTLETRNYKYALPISKLLRNLLVGDPKLLSERNLSEIIFKTPFLLLDMVLEDCIMCDERVQVTSQFLSMLKIACLKNEPVRSKVTKCGIVRRILELLCKWSKSSNEILAVPINKEVLQESCSLLRSLTFDDDMGVEFGDGAETARSIASADITIATFLKLISDTLTVGFEGVLADLLLTLSTFIAREEFCLQFMEEGGIDILFKTLASHLRNPTVVSSCLALMRAVCMSDECKRTVGTHSIAVQSTKSSDQKTDCHSATGVHFLIEVLEHYISTSPVICKHAAWVLAAITLRQPDIAEMVVSAGAPHLLGQALETYLDHPSTVRAVCMAIRNCVSRTPDLRSSFVSQQQGGFDSDPDPHSIEKHLNKALKVPQCADEAKAALRDLGCNVELRELWVSSRKRRDAS